MNVVLQTHGAKHIYKVPEGLRELCTDISREVSIFTKFLKYSTILYKIYYGRDKITKISLM